MLHAKDLMVGDWVIVYEKSMPVKAKVEGVYGKMATVLGHQRIVEKSFVEPIPLTPEILEKNGVVKPKLSWWRRLESPCGALWLAQHTDGSWWLYSSDDCDKHENFAEIHYVHQLQHALRLCGIEMEIEL